MKTGPEVIPCISEEVAPGVWPVAFILTATYFIFISRHYQAKVSVRRDNQGFY